MMAENKKDITYYMGMEYPYRVLPDEDEFFVEYPDLPGCMTQVENAEDIHTMAQEIKQLWLETALENGQRIPEPASDEFSGRFVARVPKSLHRDLARQAKEDGVSLNTHVVHLLSRGVESASPQINARHLRSRTALASRESIPPEDIFQVPVNLLRIYPNQISKRSARKAVGGVDNE